MRSAIIAVTAIITLGLGSCSASKGAAAGASVKGSWAITEACGVSTAKGMNPAEITFENGKMHGCTSINNFFGGYKLSGNKLQLTDVGMTRMMGHPIEVEDAVTQALNSAATVSVSGDSATIFDASGKAVMHLKRK